MINNIDIEIGKLIKKCRKEKGDTLEQLAEKLECTRQTVSNWEKGKITFTIDELTKLCNCFNCDIGYLLGEYNTKKHIDADIQKETGLSETAIKRLRQLKKNDTSENAYRLKVISFIIENEEFWKQYLPLSSQYFSLINRYTQRDKTKYPVELTDAETVRYSIMRLFENLLDKDYKRYVNEMPKYQKLFNKDGEN